MYKKNVMSFLFSLLIAASSASFAENSQDFGDYVVHFNALNTTYLPPTATHEYGIKRSKNRGMINIAILYKMLGTAGKPVAAAVTANATNLTGQKRDISLREVREGPAIYYIGDVPVANDETLVFTVDATPVNETRRFSVRFQRQFFAN